MKKKDRGYFWETIFPLLLTGVLSLLVGFALRQFEVHDLKKEIQNLKSQMPEMPITVIDPATKNQLYIGRPIPRPTHYEFPITLNDGQGSYRIDQYRWFSRFKGALIVQREKPGSSNPK